MGLTYTCRGNESHCVCLLQTTMPQIPGTLEYQNLRRHFGHLSTPTLSGWTTPLGMATMGDVTPLQPAKTKMVSIFVHTTSNGFSCFKLTCCTHIQIVIPTYHACSCPSVLLAPFLLRSRTSRNTMHVGYCGNITNYGKHILNMFHICLSS